jgi:hypothetical protein
MVCLTRDTKFCSQTATFIKKRFGLVDTYKILFTDGVTKREGGVDGRHATGSPGMYNSSINISQRIFVSSDILVANSPSDGIR